MITLYGVKTCDTCRKARRWLEAASIDYRYIDLRDDGIDAAHVQAWLDAHGDKQLINKRSRTWRELDTAARAACEQQPLPYLLQQPTLIKRPVLDTGTTTLVGFAPARYEAALTDNT